ncbi:iron chelate uptake ABC transporter family permease subunit [Sodalis sp. RH20]|uniref:iron chelate uptake ABC transporter family permease subunit n=1 Tax=unclassified Sodalis (in: enterobacteria) TaxID=2636512 RepID=UPI0039B5F239
MAEFQEMRPGMVIILLVILTIIASVAFMTVGAGGHWSFVLPLRAQKLAGLLLIGYAMAVSTVLFQTITQNRILTPSIMGFDALYVLIQTLVAFTIGYVHGAAINPYLRFAVETFVMVSSAALLYHWLFAGGRRDLMFLALAGLVFGGLLRSLSNFLQRVIDPGEFAVLQDRLFASFNLIDSSLLSIAAILVFSVSVIGWRMRRSFDVLVLGRDSAINLGIDYTRTVRTILMIIAILVSVSTALVGPVTFFGLLVANLAYRFVGNARHALMLPASALTAMICLVGGQLVLERLFGFNTSLSIVIEFFGGIAFIILIMQRAR